MSVTPLGHSTTHLGDVARFIRGITFKPTDLIAPSEPGAVVCMRTKNVQANLDQEDVIAIPSPFVRRDEQYLRHGDILVSSANSWNLVGKCCWIPNLPYPATAGGFISILRANTDRVRPRYLYYWLVSAATQFLLRHCGRQTTNISNLDYRQAEALSFPLPVPDDPHASLLEQDRIAAILDKADDARRKRAQAIQTTDALIPAVFREMVGSLLSNTREWPVVPLGDYCEEIQKVNPTRTPALEFAYINIASINTVEGRIELPQRLVGADAPSRARQKVRVGDVLVSTVRPNLRQTAMVSEAYEGEICSTGFAVLRPDPEKLDPLYLFTITRDPWFTNTLVSMTSGASYPAVRHKDVLTVRVPVPPINLQREFAEKARAVHRLQERMRSAGAELDNLFNSLLQRAFKGELR